jgi:AAHS family benzoate transporter-like MFS transporter
MADDVGGVSVNAADDVADGRVMVTTRRGADLLAVSLMFIFITGAVTLSLMPVVTNELRTSVGLTDAQIGLLTSVFMGFYGVSGISSGIGAARWGGRLLVVSCGCFVVGSVIFALSTGMGGFLVGRAIQGVGGGMVIATCGPVIAHALPPERWGRAWGILGSGWGLGTMAALLIMPSIQSAGGYRAVFLATAGLGVVVGAAALSQRAIRALPHHPEGTTTLRGLAASLAAAISNRRVVLLGFANTAGLAIGVGILVWTPSFLQDVHQSGEAISVYLLAGLGAAQLVGNPLGAVVDRHWSKLAVIAGCLAVMVVVTALTGIVPGVPLVFVMVLLCGFFSMLFFPPMLSYIPQVVAKPEQVGPATGINSAMGFVGSLVAPWIFGLFLDTGNQSGRSYLAGYLMLAAFGVAAIVSLAFFKGSKKRAA